MGKTLKKKNRKIEKKLPDKNPGMALAYAALNVADYLTTRRILNTGGEELNPIADFLIRKKCFGMFKIAATLGGMFVIHEEDEPAIVSKALLGFYGYLVAHNIREIVQHEREIKGEVA